VKYRISLKAQGEKTVVSVLNSTGAPETSPVAQKIVGLLQEDLK
jgi:outer membrane protein assembly factor BamC